MSFSYRLTDLIPPSTMTMQKDSVIRHTPAVAGTGGDG
jgi:hypothetical protein